MDKRGHKTEVKTNKKQVDDEKMSEEKNEITRETNTRYADNQLRKLLTALEAFRKGDVTVRLTKEKHDIYGELVDSFNALTERVGGLTTEVSRVAKVAGKEGKLTERASVADIEGAWKDLIDTVNMLLESIAKPTLEVGRILENISKGNLTEKFAIPVAGDFETMASRINRTLDDLNTFSGEVTRVAKEVGSEGKLGGQAEVPGVAGTWKDLTDNVNTMAANLTSQVREIAKVVTSISEGDLTQKVAIEAKGEVEALADTINKMVDNLSAFSDEVTRVAKEVGSEGKLGGQAEVPGVAGTWKDLTDNVNTMAANLTSQVREIAKVVTSISEGDLTQKVAIEAKGEVEALADTINKMVDNLDRLTGEVARVASVVGVEGRLNERAEVPGASGSWKDVVDTLNGLIESIATPVLEVSRIVTAMSEGDLTQKFEMKTAGGIKVMTDNLNSSIGSINTLVRQARDASLAVSTLSQGVAVSGEQMKNISDDVSTSVQQIAGGARAQTEKVVSASQSMEQISKAAGNVATKAERVDESARSMGKTATKGTEMGEATVKGMDTIYDAATKATTTVEALGERSEEIGRTVGVITDIAAQTNLLALNAAIEAARAGETGRGFAVVAEEVRKLAEGSKKSAAEIEDIIGVVQKDIAESVTSMKTMSENVVEGRESVIKVADAFKDIDKATQEVLTATQEISVAAGQQKASIEPVVSGMEEISTISEQASTGAEESSSSAQELTASMQELATSAQELSTLAENLQTSIGAFTLMADDEAIPTAKPSTPPEEVVPVAKPEKRVGKKRGRPKKKTGKR